MRATLGAVLDLVLPWHRDNMTTNNTASQLKDVDRIRQEHSRSGLLHATSTYLLAGNADREAGLSFFLCAQIVELLNIVYCLAELTEFAAFIHLRLKAPNLRRPFRVGLPTWGCILMLTPATMLLFTLILQPIMDLDLMVSRDLA